MVSRDEIQQLADRIAGEFEPERIILFGSYAWGRPDADSDVDLLVLAQHEGKGWEYASRIRETLRPAFPLDIIVRTPAETEARIADGDPFLAEIIGHGSILYEACHP